MVSGMDRVSWNWNKKMLEDFCWCGRPAIKILEGQYLCDKHPVPRVLKPKIGRYSGKSKTPFGGYEDR